MFWAIALALAAPAGASAVEPASEATVDAFVAAIPQSSAEPRKAMTDSDREALAALNRANPGREKEVELVMGRNQACQTEAQERAVTESLRSSARRLGETDLKRLVEFYSGPAFERFKVLSVIPEEDMTAAQKAEVARLLADYPLEKYRSSVSLSERAMWSDEGLFGRMMDCERALQAEIERRGLKPDTGASAAY